MTRMEQTSAVEQFGYTRREAEFLVTAALHSGYFLTRQFREVRGKVAFYFRRKILAYGHGSATTHANGLRLIHLSGKPLYAALGQEDNRHRRPRDPVQVRLKLMALDYVLQHPDSRFLPTEQEKMEYFTGERGLSEGVLPSKVYAGKGSNTRRYFIDKMPIRIDADGRVSFCYIDDGVFIAYYFHTWLEQYSRLIAAIPGSNLVYIASSGAGVKAAQSSFEAAFVPSKNHDSPEILRYFALRKQMDSIGFRGETQTAIDAYKSLRKTFAGPPFEGHYEAWLTGESAPPNTPTRPTFEAYKLPFTYPVYRSVLRRKANASG